MTKLHPKSQVIFKTKKQEYTQKRGAMKICRQPFSKNLQKYFQIKEKRLLNLKSLFCIFGIRN